MQLISVHTACRSAVSTTRAGCGRTSTPVQTDSTEPVDQEQKSQQQTHTHLVFQHEHQPAQHSYRQSFRSNETPGPSGGDKPDYDFSGESRSNHALHSTTLPNLRPSNSVKLGKAVARIRKTPLKVLARVSSKNLLTCGVGNLARISHTQNASDV